MKRLPKRICILALAAIPLLGIYIGYKLTHGLVLLDIYAHKSLKFNADAGNGIRVDVEIRPSPIVAESEWNTPTIKDKGPLGLYSRAEPRGSFVAINFVSEAPLLSAQVDSLTVKDNRGVNTPQDHQKQWLTARDREPSHDFTCINYMWHGIYVEGSGEIKISGAAILLEGNKEIPFQATIPIKCLRMRTIMTRKKWYSYFYGTVL